MDSEETPVELSFQDALTELIATEPLPIHLVYRLSDMSNSEMEELRERWSDATDDRRGAIARHMADISEEDFVVHFGRVFRFLFDDPDPGVKIAALDGVWDSTDTGLIAPIVAMLESDSDTAVRAAAARALTHFILLAEWGEIEQDDVSPAIDALIETYQATENPPEVRGAALEAASPAHHPEIPGMILEAYESSNEGLQLSAIFAMGNSADERWVPMLLDELENPDHAIRAEAARAAGAIGHPDAVSILAEMAQDDDLELATAAIIALSQIQDDMAQRILMDMAEDEEFEYLHELIEDAIEESEWGIGEMNFFNPGDQFDNDDPTSLFSEN